MVVTGLAVAAAAWGVLMGLSPMLQIRQMLRRRSSRDVSISYFGVLMIGFVLWISYGIAARTTWPSSCPTPSPCSSGEARSRSPSS